MARGPSVRKLYYSIGEVSELTGIPPHVLRYWESEFPQLRPKKGRSGNRTYQEKDLQVISQIRALLYDQRYTISGARAQLSMFEDKDEHMSSLIDDVKRELQEILDLYDNASGRGAVW